MNGRHFWMALFAVGSFAAASAKAAERQWQYRLVPYVWAAGVDGRLAHDSLPITLHPKASFSDVLSNLDVAGMLAFEAHRERFGVFADAMVVDVSTTVRIPVGSLRIPIGVKADSTTALLAMQYRWLEADNHQLDLVAGIRYWSLGTRFNYTLPSEVPEELPIPREYHLSQRERWPDLQVGLKGNYTFGNGIFVGGMALAGAGGSDLATDLMLLAGYRFSDRTSLVLGYRRLDVDFSSGGFVFDATLHGPGLGLEFKF